MSHRTHVRTPSRSLRLTSEECRSRVGDARPMSTAAELTVLIRQVRPDDKRLLADGIERLSPESRYRRFFRPLDGSRSATSPT